VNPHSALPDEDLARIVAYLDGDLGPDEKFQFELRMAERPELAAAFEDFARMDDLQQRVWTGWATRRAQPRWYRRTVPLAIAAALLLAATLGVWSLLDRPAAPMFEVAALPSDVTQEVYARRLGLPAGVFHSGERGSGETPPPLDMSRPEKLELAAEAEAGLRKRAVAGGDGLQASFFRLPVQVDRPSSVVVVALAQASRDPRDAAERLFPPPNEDGPAASWTEPGSVRVLPRPAFLPRDDDPEAIRYDAGFVVRPGTGAIRVLIGVRPGRLEIGLLPELDALLASLPLPTDPSGGAVADRQALVENWLGERGFELESLSISEVGEMND